MRDVFRIWPILIRTNNSLLLGRVVHKFSVPLGDTFCYAILSHCNFVFVLPPLPIEVLSAKKPIHCSKVSKSDPSFCLVVIPTTSGSSHVCRAGECAVYSPVSGCCIPFACQQFSSAWYLLLYFSTVSSFCKSNWYRIIFLDTLPSKVI
jgi:hypothetical protein